MKHIVIIVASARRNGNCELLARYARRFIQTKKIEATIVNIKDFRIEACQGCMSCIFKGIRCKLNDNLYNLISILMQADAIILLAPTYILTVPGKIKMVLDRFLCIYPLLRDRPEIPAISIGIAAPIDWHQLQLPLLNLFLLALGCRIIDSFFLYGAGPGEVLLNNGIEQIEQATEKILTYQSVPYTSTISDHCPVDFSTLFEKTAKNLYRCPICLTPAEARADGFFFDQKDLNNHRWTKARLKEHFDEWILKTEDRFRELLPRIYKIKKDLELF